MGAANWKSRTVISLLALSLLVTVPGCSERQREATAEAATGTGEVLLICPHPAARIAGVVLVVIGNVAKIVLSFVDGSTEDVELSKEQIQQALRYGVKLETSDGAVIDAERE